MKSIITIMLAVTMTLTVRGEEAVSDAWTEREQLTGDWGGARTSMEDAGFTPFAYYNFIYAGNVDGGIEEEDDFAGDLYLGINIDLEKQFGWDDTILKLSGIDRHGDSIDESVGSQYSTMQLVGGQTTFLYELNLEKTFNEKLALKLGRTTATDDFVGSPLYSYSLNNAVNGQIRAVLFDGVMTSYPFPVWGGRAKYASTEEHTFQFGVYQLTEDMFDPSSNGLDFDIDGDDGVSLFAQYDWRPEINGRPARFYVGMNNAFWDDMPTIEGTSEDYLLRLYGHGEVEVVDDLTLFLTLAYTDEDNVAIIPLQSSFGANYKGLIPGRGNDRTVFFVTYGEFSDEAVVAEGASEKDCEMVYELGHRIQITPSLYAQPDIQYVVNPGGTGDIDDALVLGVQAGATF